MQFTLTRQDQESILALNGELTLLHADRFKNELIQVLDSARGVVIDIRALTGIDLACLQLFCSAHHYALARGIHLSLDLQQSEVFQRQIARSGLVRCHLCGRHGKHDCLWNGGDQ
jgi:anti-anti-sigma regulatory factor